MRTSILEIEAVHFKMEQSFLKRALMDLSLLFVLIFILPGKSLANVILIGNNMSMSFDDMEATFAAAMKGLGVCGILQVAEPLDACSALTNKAVSGEGANTPFALIIRGTCSFATKVQNAEDAGFRAAIVYNNEDSRDLVAMDGNPKGITIYAVFVSKAAGQVLLKYAGDPNMECWILPSSDNTAWLVLAISFVSLLAISALLATFFFVRRHRLQHMDRGLPRVHQLHGMSARQVKALPSLIFSSVADDNCTSETCAICLEDYTAGEKLRVLPCHHRFHSLCIDSWLTMWRTFCPVCKRDAKTKTGEPSATENTPLLSVTPLLSSPNISAHSSLIGSPPMLIPSNSLLSHATSSQSRISHNVSLYMPRTSGSCGISVLSRDSVNIGNTSLLSSDAQSSLFSPQNSVCVSPQRTPTSVGSRYESPYISGSYNSSPQIDATFSLPPPIPSCGGSLSVISPFNSTHSLPGYQECCV